MLFNYFKIKKKSVGNVEWLIIREIHLVSVLSILI